MVAVAGDGRLNARSGIGSIGLWVDGLRLRWVEMGMSDAVMFCEAKFCATVADQARPCDSQPQVRSNQTSIS